MAIDNFLQRQALLNKVCLEQLKTFLDLCLLNVVVYLVFDEFANLAYLDLLLSHFLFQV